MREQAFSRAIADTAYITAKEAAAIYRCTPEYIARLCRSGRLHGKLEGRVWHVREASLQDLIHVQGKERASALVRLSKARKAEYAGHRDHTELYTALFETIAALPRARSVSVPKTTRRSRTKPLADRALALSIAVIAIMGNYALLTGEVSLESAGPIAAEVLKRADAEKAVVVAQAQMKRGAAAAASLGTASLEMVGRIKEEIVGGGTLKAEKICIGETCLDEPALQELIESGVR